MLIASTFSSDKRKFYFDLCMLIYLLNIWCQRLLLLLVMHMPLLSGMLAVLMIAAGAQKWRLGARTPACLYLINFPTHCYLIGLTANGKIGQKTH